MNNQTLLILALSASALSMIMSAIALVLSSKLKKWRRIFEPENQPDNLEEIITSITEMIKKIKTEQNSTASTIKIIEKTLESAFQYSSVVRFNSDSNDGGNLSFCVALLNGQQTGMIITSLHGRQHNRIYCKNIVQGQSRQPLNEEEKQAFIEAMTGASSSED